MLDRGKIFHVYNLAKRTDVDRERLNRALGLVLRKDGLTETKWGKYHTTLESCDCPDHRYRGIKCKHMIAYELWMNTEPELPHAQAEAVVF